MSPKQVIDYFGGSQTAVAKAIGVKQPSIAYWVATGKVPLGRQYQLEQATKGKLRADLPAMRGSK